MKIFTEKKIIQKIIIAIVVIMLFNFIIPNISHADDEESGVNGVLFEPIKDFLVGIGDVAAWIMNKVIYKADETFLDIYYKDNFKGAIRDADSFWEKFTKGFDWIGEKIEKWTWNFIDWANFEYEKPAHSLPKHVRLPMIMLSPEEIFKGEVPLLNVNFFNPPTVTETSIGSFIRKESPQKEKKYEGTGSWKSVINEWLVENGYDENIEVVKTNEFSINGEFWVDHTETDDIGNQICHVAYSWKDTHNYYVGSFVIDKYHEIVTGNYGIKFLTNYNSEKYALQSFVEVYSLKSSTNKDQKFSSSQLQPIISKWYYALRNLAIVALLSILAYIAIRIIISSSMEDRAKYKQHLLDWLVAMCLLFFMHYIMSFAVTLTEEITKAVEPMSGAYPYLIEDSGSFDGRSLSDYYAADGTPIKDVEVFKEYKKIGSDYNIGDRIVWPVNLMGKARLDLQMEPPEYDDNQILMKNFSLTIIYLGLVMYTVLFLFRYLKRLLMLTFLTIIAPFMAMTYPLDKMHDNSAQGFNMWLKEYIFNLLIQPVHLILYTVLIGSAIEFASENIIYSLVAFGFMLQAEKIMRKLFGFDKAETASATSAALGGALAMQGIEMISKHLNNGKKNEKDKQEKNKITQANRKPDKDINELTRQVFGTTSNSAGGNTSGAPTNNGGVPGTSAPNGQNASQNNNQTNGTGNNQAPNQQGAGNGSQTGQTQSQNGTQGAGSAGARTVQSQQEKIVELVQNKVKEKLEEHKLRKLANRVGNSRLGKATKYVGPKLAKTGLKAVLKAGLMATGATIGLTAGLVSDDFSNVFKYGAAGAGAGLLAGNAIPNKISNLKDSISKEYEGLYEATHTKEEMNARMDKKALSDKERIKKYQEKFGVDRAGAQIIMRKVAQQYRDYGITDDDIIIKAIQNKSLNDEEKIMLAKMASQVNGDEEKYDALKEGLRDRGISIEAVERYLNTIRDMNNWV